ncbi:hypothetical protein [Singulisphaera sp. PoT]|uniref:hypothetical protein n=1 Tax=Singulisphaera sp. PoT TaxID=3411797 RepID=UPI003BF60128
MRSKQCSSCGGAVERGTLHAQPADMLKNSSRESFRVGSEFSFVRPGTPTSPNPIVAFQQGLRQEPVDQPIPIVSFRCVECGRVELYATND